jgi:hypothetical protein
MKKAYIILDVMSTGNIPETRSYLEYFDHVGTSLKLSNHYFEHEFVPLDLYPYRYYMIDAMFADRVGVGQIYKNDLEARIKSLAKLGFTPVFANLWERFNYKEIQTSFFPIIDIVKKHHTQYLELHGSRSFFWWMMYEKYVKNDLINSLQVDHSLKMYDFLYLNKKPRAHRVYLYNKMLIAKALNKSLYTYRNDCHVSPSIGVGRINKVLPPEYEVPEHCDNYPQHGLDQTIYARPYNHTNISIITETMANDPHKSPCPYFFTEKIWKPIICQQPFIVYGQRGYLKCLHEIGFKTFSSVWDESYDDEPDSDKRGNKIANLARSLMGMDSEKLYRETEHIRSHNLRTFSDRTLLNAIVSQDVTQSLFSRMIKF